MANKLFIGGATATAQVDHVTPANVEIGDIFTITLADDNGHSEAISFTATAATVDNVCDGLKAAADAAKAASTAPWNAVTVTEDDTKVIITADTAGVPFYCTTSVTDGGGTDTQTLTRAASTANSGPADWNTAANWSPSGVPVASDNVYIENTSQAISYGLDQSSIALASLNIAQNYTGTIGSTNEHLQIGASAVKIGYHNGRGNPSGSAQLKIDLGTTAAAVIIENSGTPSSTTASAIQLLANNAATTIKIAKGKIAIAAGYGETTTVASIECSYKTNAKSDVDLVVGSGVTVTTIDTTGTSLVGCGATTINNWFGTLTTSGSGAFTTINNHAIGIFNSSGTVTNYNGEAGSSGDATRLRVAKTFSNVKLAKSASFKYDPDYCSLPNEIAPMDSAGEITFSAA